MKRAALLLLGLLAAASPAPPASPAPMPEKVKRTIIAELGSDPAVASTYALCPADAFLRQAPLLARFTKERAAPEASCRADPGTCFSACRDGGDAGACTGLGHVFLAEDGDSQPSQQLFSLGCAAGSGSACTNRAANLRNAIAPGDPFYAASPAVRQDCEARSFRIGCGKDDSWSCSMLGQAYQYGEGVAKDSERARSSFDKACALAPEFVACKFAQEHLRAIDRAARD